MRFLYKELFGGLFYSEIPYETYGFKNFIQIPLIGFYENSVTAEIYFWSNPENTNCFPNRLGIHSTGVGEGTVSC